MRNQSADMDKTVNKLRTKEHQVGDQANKIKRLRHQRDGLKKMLDKSQAVVKKTLKECRQLHRQLKDVECKAASTSVEEVAASAAAVLGNPTIRPTGLPSLNSPSAGGEGDSRKSLMMSLASMRGQPEKISNHSNILVF